MKFIKNNFKLIIGFIIGVVLASSITVYAYNYIAGDISYTKPGTETTISVEEALNELYAKKDDFKILETGTYTVEGISKGTEKQFFITFKNDYTNKTNIHFLITSITQKTGELYFYSSGLNRISTDSNGKWGNGNWIYNGGWASSDGSITFEYAVVEGI